MFMIPLIVSLAITIFGVAHEVEKAQAQEPVKVERSAEASEP